MFIIFHVDFLFFLLALFLHVFVLVLSLPQSVISLFPKCMHLFCIIPVIVFVFVFFYVKYINTLWFLEFILSLFLFNYSFISLFVYLIIYQCIYQYIWSVNLNMPVWSVSLIILFAYAMTPAIFPGHCISKSNNYNLTNVQSALYYHML